MTTLMFAVHVETLHPRKPSPERIAKAMQTVLDWVLLNDVVGAEVLAMDRVQSLSVEHHKCL